MPERIWKRINGRVRIEDKIKELGSRLKRMGIEFVRNDIPNYRDGKPAYRVFVFGCDIRKVEQLKAKYMDR